MTALSERLKEFRKVKEYTQQEMADFIGITKSSLNNYEQGIREPKLETLELIADQLNVSIDYLTGKTDYIDCPICHFGFSPLNKYQLKEHSAYHQKFLEAVKSYCFDIPDYREANAIRSDAIERFINRRLSLIDRADAFDDYLRSDFALQIYKIGLATGLDYDDYCVREIDGIIPDYSVSDELRDLIRARHNLPKIDALTTSIGYRLNVIGQVAAGIPIEQIEDVIDSIPVDKEVARSGQHFGLKIHGDSMEPKISDGDYVIVHQQKSVESGEVAIVSIENESAACKRIKKLKDGLMLISTNPSYEPLFFTWEDVENKPVEILGRVIEVRSKL